MNYSHYKPRKPLASFVDYFFCFDGLTADHKAERFVPDGNVELLIDLNEKPQPIYDNESLEEIQSVQHVWTSGLRTKPITIHSGDNSSMMVVGFKKGMAYPFFPFPMDEISDTVVDADLVWGDSFTRLREELLGANSSDQRFFLLEEHLVRMLHGTEDINGCVSYAVEQLTRDPLNGTLASLTEKIGYSQKHFISMFKKRVGVTPKSYQKIMRFRVVLDEVCKTAEPEWTDIALKCGFYDQAHFINDFRKFSGFSPSEYIAFETEDPSYIPVG